MRRRFFRAAGAWALLLALALPVWGAAKIEPKKVLTLDPMLELLVQFIGGPYVRTTSALYWGPRDQLAQSRGRVMSGAAYSQPLIALDRKQYDDFATSTRRGRAGALTKAERERPALFCLFSPGVRTVPPTQFYGDPANLPYTAQQVMNALCGLMPERFAYFQRRLGEFNARLRSVLISGRRRFAGVKVLCLSELWRPFFEASGAIVSSPAPAENYRIRSLARAGSWKGGMALGEPLRDGRLIVCDWRTEPSVRRGLATYAGAVYLPPPRDEDVLFYIHHMILIMGSRLDQMK